MNRTKIKQEKSHELRQKLLERLDESEIEILKAYLDSIS